MTDRPFDEPCEDPNASEASPVSRWQIEVEAALRNSPGRKCSRAQHASIAGVGRSAARIPVGPAE